MSDAVEESKPQSSSLGKANFPTSDDGRTFHLQTKKGEVASRIVTVGSHKRAELFASFLENVVRIESNRGYLTFTGTFRGVPISVVGIGMGFPMMDMFLREAMHCCEGDVAIVRFGTCGAFRAQARPGHICVADEALFLIQNPNAWAKEESSIEESYFISEPIKPDEETTRVLASQLEASFGADRVHLGCNVTCDSYFGAQGRQLEEFEDRNAGLVEHIQDKYPSAVNFEMETFTLFHLARVCRRTVKTAGAALVLAQRNSDEMISPSEVAKLEAQACEPLLETLLATQLANVMDDERCVWNH